MTLLVKLGIKHTDLVVGDERSIDYSDLEKRVMELSHEGRSLVLGVRSEVDGGEGPLSFDAIGGPWTLRAVRWDAIQRKFLLYGWQIARYECCESLTIEEALRLVDAYRGEPKKRRHGMLRIFSRS